ncbi:hypothetical protein [Photobacterium damselae]|uniref:hypothetical protein n=1 Tax=Photobacterium damselae TaxID=38293 RepID=UPI001F367DDB|nr:hypothetical protein [Photobacterium damselae]UKA04586.1 hypothetical protein IHC89_23495 [Photobacterium damselae subsp. damselae]
MSALIVWLMVWWVDFAEIEEANGIDKSPKHRLIFSPRNKIIFAFLLLYMILVMVV